MCHIVKTFRENEAIMPRLYFGYNQYYEYVHGGLSCYKLLKPFGQPQPLELTHTHHSCFASVENPLQSIVLIAHSYDEATKATLTTTQAFTELR